MTVEAPSIFIQAPVEKVFEFWADPANLTRLSRDLPYFDEVIEDVQRTPDGVGTTYRTVIRVRGVRVATVTDRYVAFDPNRRIVDQPSGLNPTITITFTREGSGTRVRMEATPVPWTARVPLLGSSIRDFHHRRFRGGLQALRSLMEEPSVPAPGM